MTRHDALNFAALLIVVAFFGWVLGLYGGLEVGR